MGNFSHYWKYFSERTFKKKIITWVFLLLHLAIVLLLSFIFTEWFLGMQEVRVNRVPGKVSGNWNVSPTIRSVDDFFACVFPNLIFLPLIVWTASISPISHLLWQQIKEIVQKTQEDGTDSFFLFNEFPTSRKQIFWGKMFFLVSSLVSLHLVVFALPLSLLLWKTNYFTNFTRMQTGFFLVCNFLVTPIFFFIPLVVLFSAVASLNSFWYTVLRVIIGLSLSFFVCQVSWGKMNAQSQWFSQHYLLFISIIIGVIVPLSFFATQLAYKEFQRKDFV